MSGSGSGGVTVKKRYAGCKACALSTSKYSSASKALQHLHAVHFECPLSEETAGRTKDRPHDDPCYAYVKFLGVARPSDPDTEAMTKEFIDRLSDISGTLNKIQWLVATNSQNNPQGRRRGGNHYRRPSTPTTPLQPQLPRSLVDAFDEIVAYYVLQAKRLSLQNRAIAAATRHEPMSAALFYRNARLADRCRDTRTRVQGYLHQARRDIILLGGGHGDRGHGDGGDGDDDAPLGIQAFDTTSFMRALVASALDTTLSMRLPEPSAAKREGAAAWDIITMYKEYSNRLHRAAARRPRRRLFLDIHALEDELSALESLLAGNVYGIKWILERLPGPYDEDDDSLKAFQWKRRYREERTIKAERYYWIGRRDAVEAKLHDVRELQKSASALRERVKQLIEITDEYHGKAIRVFTIVTVLFLPMTFVSGFFGMNTVDIRNTDSDQSLYWTVAIPVTVVVLALAFIYGYKGDEIGDWIYDSFSRAASARWQKPAEAWQPKAVTHTIEEKRVNWPMAGIGAKGVRRALRNPVRYRKRSVDPERLRHPTFYSDEFPKNESGPSYTWESALGTRRILSQLQRWTFHSSQDTV